MSHHTRAPLFQTHLFLMMLPLVFQAQAQTLAQVEFDPRFLSNGSENTLDLSRFSRGNILEPGTHPYDIYLNSQWLGREDIKVVSSGKNQDPTICFTADQIEQWHLNENALPDPEAFLAQLQTDQCIDVNEFIPDIQVMPATSELALYLTIPQAYTMRQARGYVNPAHWQQGVTAGFVNYNLSAFHNHYRDYETQNTLFGTFNAGFNFEAWRFRHNASYSHESHRGHKYRNLSSYVQRDIAALRSQLTMGQSFTQSTIFNSVPYTGVQINSDDRMLPDSLNGFAPVIQGVADSNARVSVFQNDNQIYETTVPPGPFVIDDLYNTGYAGDLEVVITETDGQIKRFTVPYASVAQLLRPGQSRYSLTAGRYRDRNMTSKPFFFQATYQRGLNNLISAYGGAIAAEHYLSAQLGMAFNTSVGAFAVDATHSHASNLPNSWLHTGGSSNGQSYRLSFSKLLPSTQTNFTLAAYRFSSSGYLTLADFVRAKNPGNLLIDNTVTDPWTDASYYVGSFYPQRHRFQLSINQKLGDYGSLYISGNTQSYWNRQQKSTTTYQIGYNKSFSWGSMNLNVSRFNNSVSSSTTQTMLSLNIPIGRDSGPTLSTSITRSNHGDTSALANLHGTTGDRRQLSYSVYGTHQEQNSTRNNSAGGSLQYAGHHAQTSGSFSTSNRGSRQASLNLNGSVVAHANGLNFVRDQGDTFAILHVPGATGATINGSNGSVINASGYGVASNLIPYRNNMISIDPNGSSLDVEIVGSVKNVAPTAGAIVMLEYDTQQGQAVLMNARMSNGEVPPMGATVRHEDQTIAQVGQSGRIFLRGVEEATTLTVSWGPDASQQCQILYTPPTEIDPNMPFARQSVQCTLPERT